MAAKTKLTLYVALLFIIVVLSISTLGFVNFKSSSIDNYSAKLSDQAYLVSKAVEQNVNRYFSILNLVSTQLTIEADGSLDAEKVTIETHRIKNELDVLNAYVGMENGDTYATSDNGLIPHFNATTLEREWYIKEFSGEKNIVTTPY